VGCPSFDGSSRRSQVSLAPGLADEAFGRLLIQRDPCGHRTLGANGPPRWTRMGWVARSGGLRLATGHSPVVFGVGFTASRFSLHRTSFVRSGRSWVNGCFTSLPRGCVFSSGRGSLTVTPRHLSCGHNAGQGDCLLWGDCARWPETTPDSATSPRGKTSERENLREERKADSGRQRQPPSVAVGLDNAGMTWFPE
jgi:hypothetical protein